MIKRLMRVHEWVACGNGVASGGAEVRRLRWALYGTERRRASVRRMRDEDVGRRGRLGTELGARLPGTLAQGRSRVGHCGVTYGYTAVASSDNRVLNYSLVSGARHGGRVARAHARRVLRRALSFTAR